MTSLVRRGEKKDWPLSGLVIGPDCYRDWILIIGPDCYRDWSLTNYWGGLFHLNATLLEIFAFDYFPS
ncbi:MAG TPA: hypothetical protein PLF35_08060, partial [Prolixibacteraceae bacterium]|nr:hypothetical protein [Prolixibacteraceae bacterium]